MIEIGSKVRVVDFKAQGWLPDQQDYRTAERTLLDNYLDRTGIVERVDGDEQMPYLVGFEDRLPMRAMRFREVELRKSIA